MARRIGEKIRKAVVDLGIDRPNFGVETLGQGGLKLRCRQTLNAWIILDVASTLARITDASVEVPVRVRNAASRRRVKANHSSHQQALVFSPYGNWASRVAALDRRSGIVLSDKPAKVRTVSSFLDDNAISRETVCNGALCFARQAPNIHT